MLINLFLTSHSNHRSYQTITEEAPKLFKDTHREKAPSNKTPALTESTNMRIWVAVISNQLFRRGS